MLEELVAYARGKDLHVMIEVKDKNLAIVKKIDDLISAYNSDLFVIYSFHKKIVMAFANLQPKYSIRWNIEKLSKKRMFLAKKIGVGINLNRRFLLKSDIEKITAAGLDLHVYTVNSKRQAKELLEQGVKAIITDTLFGGELDEK
jgi:glycerophosphoryl diester phosphodiesterase